MKRKNRNLKHQQTALVPSVVSALQQPLKDTRLDSVSIGPNRLAFQAYGAGMAKAREITQAFHAIRPGLPRVTQYDVRSNVKMVVPGPEGKVLVTWEAKTELGCHYLECVASAIGALYPNLLKDPTQVWPTESPVLVHSAQALLEDNRKQKLLGDGQ